jgi:regulator of nonsense transcripts 3
LIFLHFSYCGLVFDQFLPQTPDGAAQQSSTPVKNIPPSSSRLDKRSEANGRIIKTVLSNKEVRSSNPSQHEQEGHMFNTEKDKRPPRALNPRTVVKDQVVENAERSHFDEKNNYLHSSAPIGEKVERHARNRDRPDRSVWAPRRYDKSPPGGVSHALSSDFSQMQSHSGDNVSQLTDGTQFSEMISLLVMPGVSKLELNAGHGDRKTDTRGHGGSRGVPVENGLYAKVRCVLILDQFHDSVFNPGHRHANRRGTPCDPKETKISASVPDGKNSKRGSASYGAHEVRLFCNFLFFQLVKGMGAHCTLRPPFESSLRRIWVHIS